MRAAARRFINDLKRSQRRRPPFYFSARHADRHCQFIEALPHVEGRWADPTIRLEPWQVFFLVQLFGFRDLEGGRRFTEALLTVARKNAKSTLAAAIELSCLCLEPEVSPQVIAAATTGSQARIVWNIAKRMVEESPDLRDCFDVEAFANAIVRSETAGVFKPINAKASTQDGLNPSHVCLDEIHAHKTHDLMNVLRSAAGARRNPLWLYTTTEGYESPGPWPELRTFARRILEGSETAEHFLALIFELDKNDDDFDEGAWVKANPLMDANPMIAAEMRKLSVNARAMPGTLAEFRIKRLNRPAAAADSWINLTRWKKCGEPVDPDALEGVKCWAAFDLASTTDMNAWRLLWLLEDGRWATWGRYWVPEGATAQRTERRSANYAGWVAGGFVTQTSGDVADYSQIEAEIRADIERFAPVGVAYDPWNAQQLANSLYESGYPMHKFTQGPFTFNPAMKALEREYSAGRLAHGNNPVLNWNAANLVIRYDANMNLAPDRRRSADKIDGMVALAMAFGLAVAANDGGAFDDFLANPVKA